MRTVMIVAAVLAVAACNRGGPANNSAANTAKAPAANAAAPSANTAANTAAPAPAPAPAAGLPAGFPGSDLAARGAECVVYLGLASEANARPGGHDKPIMEQAAGQWRAALEIDGGMSEQEVQQLIGSSVNPLMPTPAAQRDAAAAWCVQNAPEPDPEG